MVSSMMLTSIAANGQEVFNPKSDTIKWVYVNGENKTRSEKMNISGHVISYGSSGFLWVQDGTDRKYKIDVKSFKDDWTKSRQYGELVYKAVCNGVDGTVRISREEGKVAIQLDFTQKDKLTPNVELRINSFSKI
jgi:hypothetical protein